jgi:hypothetical protein
MSYDNTNTGIIARNERKEKDTHPDQTGTINVDGVDYWLSGWIKEGRPGTKLEGKRYLSLSVRRKDAQAPASAPASAKSSAGKSLAEMDDDTPF